MLSGLFDRVSDAETERQFGEILGGVSTASNAARGLRKILAKADLMATQMGRAISICCQKPAIGTVILT
jgi:hypothetical protein